MLLLPATSSLVFISSPDPPTHPPVWDADLVELGPFGPETQPLVEVHGGRLSVKVYLRESQFCGLVHEVAHDCAADPGAAVLRQYCDATDLTAGFEAARANHVTFFSDRKHVPAGGIRVVPLLGFRNALFFDEYASTHGLERRAIVLPGRCPQFERRGRARRQTSRARRVARPMYVAGVSSARRFFSAAGSGSPSMNCATAAASRLRPRVRAFSCSYASGTA